MPGHRRLREWRRAALMTLVVVAALASALFALRTYGSFVLLRSAYAVRAPQVSSVRGWMTLPYIAAHYRVSQAALRERLGLPPQADPDASLADLAGQRGMSAFRYVRQVQQAIADMPSEDRVDGAEATGWLKTLSDETLEAVLAYGYPMLGFILLLGAIGLPVPTGLSAAVAGSLVSVGSMAWVSVTAIAVTASVLGDLTGYGIGRALSRRGLERRGRWIGYTPARRQRVERLFERLGGVTVLLTRTLVSHLSSVVNLLAGASRYGLGGFLAFTVIGRLAWTLAYLGLGYAVGADLEAAAGFLANLSFLLLSLAVFAAAALFLRVRPRAAFA